MKNRDNSSSTKQSRIRTIYSKRILEKGDNMRGIWRYKPVNIVHCRYEVILASASAFAQNETSNINDPAGLSVHDWFISRELQRRAVSRSVEILKEHVHHTPASFDSVIRSFLSALLRSSRQILLEREIFFVWRFLMSVIS